MGMYGTSGDVTSDIRMEEKTELIHLNDKLAAYMLKVRQQGTGGADFLETLRSMENDVRKLKTMYESELEKYRQKLEEANRQKNCALSEIDKHKRVACDFEDRFRCENDKNRKLMKEATAFQQRIADLERELTNIKSSAQTPQTMLANMQKDLAREQAKNKELANELDQERTKNKELEDKLKNLQQKVDFNGQLSNEQLKDTTSRLEQAKKVIKDMQAKTRELEQQNSDLPQVLDKIRKKNDEELAKYKADVENSNKKNNDMIKKQIDDQGKTMEQLKADNAKLEKENQVQMAKVRALEAQIKELNNQKACLEEQIRLERSKSMEQVRKLERQLKDLQDLLMEKMQEVNTGRDVQVTLKAEIEHYRQLLDAEERRLNATENASPVGNSRGNLSSAASSQYSLNRAISAGSDKPKGRDKLGARKAGQGGKSEPETTYQFAYNRYVGRRLQYGDSGLYRRKKTNGLPTLTAAGGSRGSSSNEKMRYSMPN